MRWLDMLFGSAMALSVAAASAAQTPETEWRTYGHDSGGMRFSPLRQITPANVAQLRQAWVYRLRPPGAEMATGGFGSGGALPPGTRRFIQSEVTPLVIDGVMYVASPYGRVVALDAVTGREIWSYAAQAPTRGVEYWWDPLESTCRHASLSIL